ncbi:Protein TyrC [Candidatus Defluviicoccus seviourii]|uniref:prephenate dehydrogenase n=1 Tax=Candidatus Defluviicoccus seviourii TaxID=2565273 RepID=A0A564WG17_9PROT|nr:Protein TyrC [Candidatus Defluviicoccus seviourii]
MSEVGVRPHFRRVALIGIGLIGSSLARVIRRDGLADHIAVSARTQHTLDIATRLGLADSTSLDARKVVEGADLVVLSVPLGAYGSIASVIGSGVKPGAIVTDVGSVKECVIADVGPHLPEGVHLVPGHPVAGTEHSGPEAGFAELFAGRYCILTPPPGTDPTAIETVTALWRQAGMIVETMSAQHHDRVLAITSHLPHLIAYTIVGTATDLEEQLKSEVIRYSAGGFRDFTRIAASDPVMWRDVFLNNRDAVLEMLGRFTEDLAALQRAIRWGEGDGLQEKFTRTREIRRGILEVKQA